MVQLAKSVRPSGGQARTDAVDLPTPATRSRHTPILVGGLLILFGGLFFLWLSGGDKSVSVVMMANSVPRGQVVESKDVVKAEVEANAPVNVIRWGDAQSVVGKTAAVDLVSNSLPSDASVTSEPSIPEGTRALGLVLAEGEVPTSDLGIGDTVDVVHVGSDVSAVVASGVPIQRIEMTSDGRWWVTLVVGEADVEAVSRAGQDNAARLSKAGS